MTIVHTPAKTNDHLSHEVEFPDPLPLLDPALAKYCAAAGL